MTLAGATLPIWENDEINFENRDLPSSLRLVICGSSGSGKTVLLLKLLLYNLDFNRLVICSPSLTAQMAYKIVVESLKAGLNKDQIVAIFDDQKEITDPFQVIKDVATYDNRGEEKCEVLLFKDPSDLPSPEQLKEGKETSKTLLIIDDCMGKDQRNINEYFIYARPEGINLVYLSQSFFKTDKKCTRDNANVLIFFKCSAIDQQNIFRHLSNNTFKTLDEFKEFASASWDKVKDKKGKSRGYIVYDRDTEIFRANCF